MGKPSRRLSRRNRPKPVRFVAAGAQLRVVVVTQPRSTRGAPVKLDHDVALVKSALLYADHVELVSAGAALVSGAGTLSTATTADALALLGSLDPDALRHVGGSGLPENFQQITQGMLMLSEMPPQAVRKALGKHATDEFLDGLQVQAAGFQQATSQLRDIATSLVDDSGLRELDDPIKLGLVTLHPLGVGDGDTDAVLEAYVQQLKGVLRDSSVHALFDDSSASLARSLVREGHVEPHRMGLVHARQAAVGGGLVARLPSFPDSDMNDVLSLRADLSAALGRYRRAVTNLAEKL
ncbi:hypothetical protein [Cellulomonas sp. Marseille-Q8402]